MLSTALGESLVELYGAVADRHGTDGYQSVGGQIEAGAFDINHHKALCFDLDRLVARGHRYKRFQGRGLRRR